MGINFPTSLDTTTSLYTAVNSLTTTINGAQTSTTTTVIVTSTTGAPSSGYITVKGEAIKYTGLTATSFTGCTRGADNTTAVSLANGDTVRVGLVADHHNILVTAIIAIENKLGTGALIAGSQIANTTITGGNIAVGTITTEKLTNPNHFRGKANAAQALAATTFTTVVFGSVVDQGSNWTAGAADTTHNKYTAPLALRYQVNASVVFKSGGTAGSVYAIIYKQGVEWSRVQGVISNTTVPTAVHISDVVTLAAGEYIQIYTWSGGVQNLGDTGLDVSFVSIAPLPS